MDYVRYYRANPTSITYVDPRLARIIALVDRLAPASLLDIGCGAGSLLAKLVALERLRATRFTALDVYRSLPLARVAYVSGDVNAGLPFGASSFESVILGEVIEHLPYPDFVLREIHRVLVPGGHLIISTPNLVSWANRILVLLGIQPFYTETSSEVKLGRHFKLLGQGSKTEGHLKIFTAQSLHEILEYTHFQVVEKRGVPFFFPEPVATLDRLLTAVLPLASGLLYVARRPR